MSVPLTPAGAHLAPESVERPFGRPVRRWIALTAAGALVVLTLAVYLLTRRGNGTEAATGGHQHGAAAAADEARPVSLAPESERRIGVTFAQVERAPLEHLVRTVAQVTYDETQVRRVVPRVDGYIESLAVDFTGQSVRAGQPLFTLYSPMIVSAEQELLLARQLTDQVQGGTADAVEGAAGLLESARKRLLYWEVPPAVIDDVLRTGTIHRTVTLRAPTGGVVVEKPVLAGQRIMAGEVAYVIADLSRVWLEGEVFEQDLPAVHLGQMVTAEFAALPGEERQGRITYIYPTLNPETRTGRVRVELPNAGLRLKPGMYATFLFTATTPPALSVPRSAVLATGKRTLVFVRDSAGSLVPREVTTGRSTDDRIEILRGVEAGETVVASATFLVDAESNLGSALGGMANMPGMEITTPPRRLGSDSAARPALPAASVPRTDSMADMPGRSRPPSHPE